MTREIKFRAWHKQEKKMYYYQKSGTIQLQVNENEDGITYYWYPLMFQFDTRPEDIEFDDDDNCKYIPLIELMQYTGLKDKNGKEGYINSITYMETWKTIGKNPYGTVKEGVFEIKSDVFNNKVFGLYVETSNGNKWSLIELLELGAVFIGNVWENPELVE